jgi:hypothetical protein
MKMSALRDSLKIRFKNRNGAVVSAFMALAMFATRAEADFLDDLFGSSEPVARVAAPTASLRRSSSRKVTTASQQFRRVKSEVRFMPSKVARTEERHSGSRGAAPIGDRNESAAGSKPVHASLCATETTIGTATPSSLLLYDKTLRSGDILVTDVGVQVFRGQAACPHNSGDFLPLSTANVSKSRRGVLVAIEDAMRRSNGYLLTGKAEKP